MTAFATANRHGYSLIELLVSMAIVSIVVAAMVSTRVSQQTQGMSQQETVDTQQTVRAALSMLRDEIRLAGYLPQTDDFDSDDVGIISNGDGSAGNTFTFAYIGEGKDDGINNDGDGSTDEADEADIFYIKTVSYWYEANGSDGIDNDGDGAVDEGDEAALYINETFEYPASTVNGNDKLLAENITALNFTYLDEDNAVTATLADIRSIFITITARTDGIDTSGGTNNTRTLQTIVNCRNLGL